MPVTICAKRHEKFCETLWAGEREEVGSPQLGVGLPLLLFSEVARALKLTL